MSWKYGTIFLYLNKWWWNGNPSFSNVFNLKMPFTFNNAMFNIRMPETSNFMIILGIPLLMIDVIMLFIKWVLLFFINGCHTLNTIIIIDDPDREKNKIEKSQINKMMVKKENIIILHSRIVPNLDKLCSVSINMYSYFEYYKDINLRYLIKVMNEYPIKKYINMFFDGKKIIGYDIQKNTYEIWKQIMAFHKEEKNLLNSLTIDLQLLGRNIDDFAITRRNINNIEEKSLPNIHGLSSLDSDNLSNFKNILDSIKYIDDIKAFQHKINSYPFYKFINHKDNQNNATSYNENNYYENKRKKDILIEIVKFSGEDLYHDILDSFTKEWSAVQTYKLKNLINNGPKSFNEISNYPKLIYKVLEIKQNFPYVLDDKCDYYLNKIINNANLFRNKFIASYKDDKFINSLYLDIFRHYNIRIQSSETIKWLKKITAKIKIIVHPNEINRNSLHTWNLENLNSIIEQFNNIEFSVQKLYALQRVKTEYKYLSSPGYANNFDPKPIIKIAIKFFKGIKLSIKDIPSDYKNTPVSKEIEKFIIFKHKL